MRLLTSRFGRTPPAIGIDLGTHSLKIAQVAFHDATLELAAVAALPVAPDAQVNLQQRLRFFQDTIGGLLSQGDFRGRRAVLSLPSSCMYVHRVRLPQLDEQATSRALLWETRGQIPVDVTQAVIRHVVAGAVHKDNEILNEIIVMAARRDFVEQLLAAAGKARLEVVGVVAEPLAMIGGLEVASDNDQTARTRIFIDVGAAGTRVYIARGSRLLFARALPIKADDLSPQTAAEPRGAVPARQKTEPALVCSGAVPGSSAADACDTAVLECEPQSPLPAAPAPATAAMRRLRSELNMCRHYHEATFPQYAIEELILAGGGCGNESLRTHLSVFMGLPSRQARPAVPLGSGIAGPSMRHPVWSVAVGLSLSSTRLAA